MTEAELIDSIRSRLTGGAGYSECHVLLRAFKDSGGEQQAAYRELQALRALVDDRTEDIVLELMDAVVGFCSPQAKIWDDYLET